MTSKDNILTSNNPSDLIKKPFSRQFHKKFEPTSARMSSPVSSETNALMRQNQELRNKLHEEANNYRRRLDTYKQAQQNQAQLVSRLQNKVMQYKQRCADLEGQMHETLAPATNYNAGGSKSVQTSLSPVQMPPTQTCTSTAPMSLPCPSSNDQHQSHSQHPIKEYRDREDCLSDDTIRRLEDERQRFDL